MNKTSPITEVDENTMIRLRYGPGAVERYAKDCRQRRKECERAQSTEMAVKKHPLGKLLIQVPDVLFFQETLKERRFWLDKEQWRTRMAQFWEEYPDMRRAKTKGNPFGRTKRVPRVI